MDLRHSYTLLAPAYDLLVARASRAMRQASLADLPETGGDVLLIGVGTGLDFPLLPPHHRYVGIDLTAAMLRRARRRPGGHGVDIVHGNALCLPFATASFDAAVLHLILAVVPDPDTCLAEAARVVRPGGRLLILDKFLAPGRPAPLRRLLNPLARRIATRLDVVFEPLLAATPGLVVETDQPGAFGGWFRRIRLRRAADDQRRGLPT